MTDRFVLIDTAHLFLVDTMKERRHRRAMAEQRARFQSSEEVRPAAAQTVARLDLSQEQSAHDV